MRNVKKLISSLFVALCVLAPIGCSSSSGAGAGTAAVEAQNSTENMGSVTQDSSTTGSITLTNTGSGVATQFSISLSGDGYSLTGGTCVDNPFLPSGAACSIEFTYAPTSQGTMNGVLTINYFNGVSSISASLSLVGTSLGYPGAMDSTFGTTGYNITAF